nr:phosphoenolpyruvate-dihydroxyacetone phosphotransferase [Raoultella sp. NCTC 9187]
MISKILLHRTLRHLQGRSEVPLAVNEPVIVIADDIFPSTVVQLDPRQVKGICLQEGSDVSHGAIIARQAGIVCLCQQGETAENAAQRAMPSPLDVAERRIIRG